MSKFSTDEDIIISLCANCGKGEESAGDLKACTSCKMAKYCNRDCQIAHRKQHKKACKERAAELHDIQLFKQPLPPEDCPICCCLCHRWIREINTIVAVEKRYAVGVFMLWRKQIRGNSAPFVELRNLYQTRRTSNS